MLSRRELLRSGSAVALCGCMPVGASGPEAIISAQDLRFLEQKSRRTLAKSTSQESVASVGFPVVTPGGSYPSFWIRDFSMAVGSGLVPAGAIRNHLHLLARCQNGPKERRLGDRARIPAFAIPDHIRYDGRPVYYPGTYSPDDDQGGEPYGVLPPIDDHYEFIHIAHTLASLERTGKCLLETIDGRTLFERLELALQVPTVDPLLGLVSTDAASRAVGFGFCDGVYFTGRLAFASLLRHRALREMRTLSRLISRHDASYEWQRQMHLIESNLVTTFLREGWLVAATDVGQQPDVWATALALHMGVLRGQARSSCLSTLAQAVRKGTITYKGAVRHVPTDADYSPASAWEKTAGIPKNRYQNGAYWHVPTGWLASALWQEDRALARSVVREMVDHFREEAATGAPWECVHPEGNYRQNPVYLASATLPLEILRQLR